MSNPHGCRGWRALVGGLFVAPPFQKLPLLFQKLRLGRRVEQPGAAERMHISFFLSLSLSLSFGGGPQESARERKK
jgi:hypothetical protein